MFKINKNKYGLSAKHMANLVVVEQSSGLYEVIKDRFGVAQEFISATRLAELLNEMESIVIIRLDEKMISNSNPEYFLH